MSSIADFLDNPIVNSTMKLFLILYAGFMFELNSTHVHGWLQNRWFSFFFISLVMFALSKKLVFSFAVTAAFYLFFYFLTNLEKKKSVKKSLQSLLMNNQIPDSDSDSETEGEKNMRKSRQHRTDRHPVRRQKLRDAIQEKRKQLKEAKSYNTGYHPRDHYVHHTMETPNTDGSDNTNTETQGTQETQDPKIENHVIQYSHKVDGDEMNPEYIQDDHVTLPKLKNKLQQFIDLQTTSASSLDPQAKFIDVSLKKESLIPYDKYNHHYIY
jgi:hypothetical protein